MSMPSTPLSGRLLLAGLLALILGFYLIEGHTRRAAFPTNASQGDQGAYLAYARQMRVAQYQAIGDRNRMPVYPFLLSLLYQPHLTEAEFLTRAQTFNVNLSAAILLLIYLLCRRHFPAYYCVALVAITAFAVFIYRASSAQTELLFYFVSCCMFLSFWKMLVAPRVLLAVWTGALVGLAHLTKASVLPALAIFIVAFVVKIIQERRMSADSSESIWHQIILLALVLATFLVVVFPYIKTSKRVFGHYFYNVNSSFYMWCDSWPEAKRLTGSHGDRVGWPTLPPEQIPSASKYWREHSLSAIAGRLGHGALKVARHNARIEGYYKYLALLAAVAGVLAIRRRTEVRELLRAHLPLILFLGLFFAGYLALCSWYVPISVDSRFLLTLFLPFTFTASKIIWRLGGGSTFVFAGRRIGTLSALTCVLFVFATVDLVYTEVWLSGQRMAPAKTPRTSTEEDASG
jgi:hypothetical protein